MPEFDSISDMMEITESYMQIYFDAFLKKLARVRTDKDPRPLLNDVKLDYYGVETPLAELATLSVPEPTSIVVQPLDPSQLSAVHGALSSVYRAQVDGQTIRVSVPSLAPRDRDKLVRAAKETANYGKHDLSDPHRRGQAWLDKQALATAAKNTATENLQKLYDRFAGEIDAALKKKVSEFDAS